MNNIFLSASCRGDTRAKSLFGLTTFDRSDAACGLRMPFRVLLLCDLGAFAGDILSGETDSTPQKHIRISRKGAEAQRRILTEGVASTRWMSSS
jgi:hypothetical protein